MLRAGPRAPYRLGKCSSAPVHRNMLTFPRMLSIPPETSTVSPLRILNSFMNLDLSLLRPLHFFIIKTVSPGVFESVSLCRSQYFCFKHIKCVCFRSSEMHRRQKCLLHKSGNLSLVPGSHRGGRNSVLGAIHPLA